MANKNKSKLAVRILAWVLMIMMVISLAYTAIYLVIQNLRPEEEDKKTTTEQIEVVTDQL